MPLRRSGPAIFVTASFSDAVIEPTSRVDGYCSSQSPNTRIADGARPSSFSDHAALARHLILIACNSTAAPTPNGVKVSIMLEETGLAYEPHS